MTAPNTFFNISDDQGHKKRFTVKPSDYEVSYNKSDVQKVVEACLAVIEDCIKRGEDINFYGIGTIGVKYRAPRMVKEPLSDVWHQVPEHYIPYWKFGNVMLRAAKIYENALRESQVNLPDPIYDIGDRELDFEDMYPEEGEEDV